jgi:hypothetical protein
VALLVVIDAVQVFAIPTAWEHQFKTNTFCAMLVKIRLVGHKMTIKGRFRRSLIVETIETQCPLLKESLRLQFTSPSRFFNIGNWVSKVALERVASEHLETVRESC